MQIRAQQMVKKIGDTSFSGVKKKIENDTKGVYKFYAPAYDKDKYALLLQVMDVRESKDGKFNVDDTWGKPVSLPESYEAFKTDGSFICPKNCLGDENYPEYLGYRFVLYDKNDYQNAVKNGDDVSKLPVAAYVNDPGVKSTEYYGAIFNIVSDKIGVTPKGGSATHIFYDSFDSLPNVNRKDFRRTHFNKAGGDIDSLIKHKKELEPYRYVMTNPYMGKDSISSHKYWGEQFYQMPSVEKFKDVVVDLYKDGKGYIADGAFTSQSIQSPYFQDVLKNGKDSEYYNWFKTEGRIRVGVLPDTTFSVAKEDDPSQHIGIKIVNPLNSSDYDSKKPSYIQFFDERLVSDEQLKDSKHLIKAYDKMNSEDPYDISTHQDSVLPYHFEIDYTDPSIVDRFGHDKVIMLKDVKHLENLLSFKNFDIVRKGEAGGADYWDGNVDMVKMNFSGPSNSDSNYEGYREAKNHLYGVATYWTKFVHDALFEQVATKIANNNTEELSEIAQKNDLTEKETEGILNGNGFKLGYKSAEEITDAFKFETIPTSPEISAMIGTPSFQEVAQDSGLRQKMANFVLDVLSELDAKEELVEEDYGGNKTLTQYGSKVADILSQNILTYAILKGFSPDSNVEYDVKKDIVRADETTRETSLKEIGVSADTYSKEKKLKQLASAVSKSLNDETVSDLASKLNKSKLLNCTSKDFARAEEFVQKTGGGLNWRFDAAKDIANLTFHRDRLESFEKSWDDVIDVWSHFVSNIKEINPSSYVIAEITGIWDFYNYTKDLYNNEEAARESFGKYFKPNEAERIFFEKTGATTGSNYSYFYSPVPRAMGQSYENGDDSSYASFNAIKNSVGEFFRNSTFQNIAHAHNFVDNHDKPRALHGIVLDVKQYLGDYKDAKGTLGTVFGENNPYNGNTDMLNPKAVTVAEAFINTSKGILKDEEAETFRKAAADLALGKFKENDTASYRRAGVFGQNPFDKTLHDVMEQAKYISGGKWMSDERAQKVEKEIYKKLLAPALPKMAATMEIMTALPGVPFTYMGDNFGMTGYEYSSKNITVANRNLIPFELVDENSKDFNEDIKKLHDRMAATAGLYKLKGMSASADGTTIKLDQNDDKHLAFYKYNDRGSEVIQVISTVGLPNDIKAPMDENAKETVSSIKISTEGFKIPDTKEKEVYRRLVYDEKTGKYVDEKQGQKPVEYIIVDGELKRKDGNGDITLNSTLTNFYKVKDEPNAIINNQFRIKTKAKATEENQAKAEKADRSAMRNTLVKYRFR